MLGVFREKNAICCRELKSPDGYISCAKVDTVLFSFEKQLLAKWAEAKLYTIKNPQLEVADKVYTPVDDIYVWVCKTAWNVLTKNYKNIQIVLIILIVFSTAGISDETVVIRKVGSQAKLPANYAPVPVPGNSVNHISSSFPLQQSHF
jgi:hypothetical protein